MIARNCVVLISAMLCLFHGVMTASAITPYPTPINMADVWAKYPMDQHANQMLLTNGVVVLDCAGQRDLCNAYPRRSEQQYIYVTTDAFLQLWYAIYRQNLEAVEKSGIYPRLCGVTTTLRTGCRTRKAAASSSSARAALADAEVTLAVAQRLLTPDAKTSADIRAQVEALTAKVMAHCEVSPYPGDDYTMYTVRGHYVGVPEMESYFRGAMWLSRRFWTVDDERPLRAAIALADVARANPPVRASLRMLTDARSALVGAPNGINIEQLIRALDATLGANWRLEHALTTRSLAALRRELNKPQYPASRVSTRVALPGQYPHKVISVLPDIAIPDSVLFQQVMDGYAPGHNAPSGLDVAAALGSHAASEELASRYGRSANTLAQYNRVMAKDDATSIYSSWLHTLATLNKTPAHAPEFMRSSAWDYAKLNTCLASWAQLRHESLLYAAQASIAYSMPGDSPQALVEQNPAFFGALAATARRASTVLRAIGGVDPHTVSCLDRFAGLSRDYGRYAQAELDGTLTPAQVQAIQAFGNQVSDFNISCGAVVADVATLPNHHVLHAATGNLHPIVVIPDRNRPVAYVGWTLSYYEFTRSANERLTDAAWNETVQAEYAQPERPTWVSAFTAGIQDEEWLAETPLREAEELFAKGDNDKGLAVLRAGVEAHRDSEVATKCQYRIGQYYGDHRLYAQAITEMQKCGYLWKCEESRQAEWAIAEYENALHPKQESDDSEGGLRALAAAQTAFNGISANAPDHAAQELTRAEELLRCWTTARTSLFVGGVNLKAQIAASRVKPVRDALRFAEIEYRMTSDDGTASRSNDARTMSDALTYVKSDASSMLRARILNRLLLTRWATDHAHDALKLVIAFQRRRLTRKSLGQAENLLARAGYRYSYEAWNSDDTFRFDGFCATEPLVEEAYATGDLELALRYARTMGERTDTPWRETITALYARYPDLDHKPLREYVKAKSIAKTDLDGAAARYIAIAQHYPGCKIELHALMAALYAYTNHGNQDGARAVIDVIAKTHPDTLLATVRAARQRFAQGDYPSVIERMQAVSSELDRTDETWSIAKEMVNSLLCLARAEQQLRASLADIAKRAGKEHLLAPPSCDAGIRDRAIQLADALKDYDEQALPIIIRCYGVAELRTRFIGKYPTHPAAEDIWAHLAEDREVSSAWVAPFINLGPQYTYAKHAWQLFYRLLYSEDIEEMRAKVRSITAVYPHRRAEYAARVVFADQCLYDDRPERALKELDKAIAGLAADDPIRGDAEALRRKVESQLSAKRAAHSP